MNYLYLYLSPILIMIAVVSYPLYRAVKKFRTHNKDRWSSHANEITNGELIKKIMENTTNTPISRGYGSQK